MPARVERSAPALDGVESTRIAREAWAERGLAIGRTFSVPPCTYSDSELADLAQQGRRVAYLPPALAGAEDRPLLAAIFPQLRSYAFLPGNLYPNDVDHAGWFDYETAIDAAERNTAESDLDEILPREGRRLLTLNEYVVVGPDLHQSTGHYPDERATWARVGSRVDGHLVAARFDGANMAEGLGDEAPAEGSLLVAYDIAATDSVRILGTRTSTMRDPSISTSTPGGESQTASVVVHSASSATKRHLSDLPGTWTSVVDTFVAIGFARELGINAEDYRRSLPHFAPQPIALAGRMDIPLLVETRIPWRRQAELAGIRFSHGIRTSDVVDLDAPGPYRGPAPYATWCNDWDQRFPGPTSAPDARTALAADEVGATIAELVSLQLGRPDLSLEARFFEAIGSAMAGLVDAVTVGEPRDRYPCMYHWRGQPELGSNLRAEPFAMFRPLVRATVTTQ